MFTGPLLQRDLSRCPDPWMRMCWAALLAHVMLHPSRLVWNKKTTLSTYGSKHRQCVPASRVLASPQTLLLLWLDPERMQEEPLNEP